MFQPMRHSQICYSKIGSKKLGKEEEKEMFMAAVQQFDESSNDESSDEEKDDDTIRKISKIPWIKLTEKYGDWVRCDICDGYICPKCYDVLIIVFDSICIKS